MATMLGEAAASEDKFAGWHEGLKILGFDEDIATCSVSMQATKIVKARLLIASTNQRASVAASEFHTLVGSLRHVADRTPAARRFVIASEFKPVTDAMRQDLLWWWHIVHREEINRTPMRLPFG